jgi:hypothetical protein
MEGYWFQALAPLTITRIVQHAETGPSSHDLRTNLSRGYFFSCQIWAAFVN